MSGSVSPVSAGVRCRCPQCGQGDLFRGYLAINPSCAACGADFCSADSGDGPAFFVVIIVGMLIVPLVLATQVAVEPPVWLQALIWLPVGIGLCLWLLRPFKAIMFALQWTHRAEEARFEDIDEPTQ